VGASLSTDAVWDEDGDGITDSYLSTGNLDGQGYTWEEALSYADASFEVHAWDEAGQLHDMHLLFERTGQRDWSWYAPIDGSEMTRGDAGHPSVHCEGTSSFDADGELISATQACRGSWEAYSLADGVEAPEADFDFGYLHSGTAEGELVMSIEVSQLHWYTQDGYAAVQGC